MVVFYTKSHLPHRGKVYDWSHMIIKLILFLTQNSLFLHENLIILFEYPQSISGENFHPNTCTIITCMKQHMHLLYMVRKKKKKIEGWRFTSLWSHFPLPLNSSAIIYFYFIFVRVITQFLTELF